jgi:hypothetical protein
VCLHLWIAGVESRQAFEPDITSEFGGQLNASRLLECFTPAFSRLYSGVTNAIQGTPPDSPLEIYAQQRETTSQVVAEAVNEGDDPATVANAIIASATDRKPKLQYPASPRARQLSTMRRFVPAGVRQIASEIQRIRGLRITPVRGYRGGNGTVRLRFPTTGEKVPRV